MQKGCTAAWIDKQVTVGVTIHDKMSKLRQKGAGGRKIRFELRATFGTIYPKSRINDSNKGGMAEFEFQQAYKSQLVIH